MVDNNNNNNMLIGLFALFIMSDDLYATCLLYNIIILNSIICFPKAKKKKFMINGLTFLDDICIPNDGQRSDL